MQGACGAAARLAAVWTAAASAHRHRR